MASQADGLHSRVRALLPEISKFCLIGGIGLVIDLGGAGLLQGKGVEPLLAKAIAVTVSTTFTYFGSRFWTFRHRERQPMRREAALFFGLNVVGLLIAEAVIALVTYVMGLHSALDYNIGSFIGSGLGTVFRFYAYNKWVFLESSAVESASVESGSVESGSVESGSAGPGSGEAAPAAVDPLPGHHLWELDPAFRVAEAEAAAKTPAAADYASPWPAPGRHRKAS
jgi:putative flippase GtrA